MRSRESKVVGARARPHRASGGGGDLNPELPGLLRKWAAAQTGTLEPGGVGKAGAEAAEEAPARTRRAPTACRLCSRCFGVSPHSTVTGILRIRYCF